MSASRTEYYSDVLRDCTDVAVRAGIDQADVPLLVAALILCDALNGLRKAILNSPVSSDRTDRRHSV
jgi:hypothetical protein